MKKLKTVLQSRYLFKILCIISITYSLIFSFCLPQTSKYSKNETEITGKIIQYQIDGNKLKLTLKGKEKIIIYYYFETESEKTQYKKTLELGLKIKSNGKLEKPKKNTIPNGFNYKNYLKYHQINYCMYANDIKIIKRNNSVLYFLKNKLINHIDRIDNTGYLRTFILGDKNFIEEDMFQKYQQNGILHLFSISGMHVSLIVGIIMFILNKVSYNNFYKYGITMLILLYYLFLTGFGASILRTVIMFIVFAINKCFNLKIKIFDLMLIVLIIAITINPYIIFDIGFQFSYSISFTLVIFNNKISNLKKKWHQNLATSILCFFVSFPICIYYYSEVNIFSIILNLVMIPIVSLIVFPMSLLTTIIPIIYPFYKIIISCLEKIINLTSNIKIFTLILSKPSLFLITIYYTLIYLTIWNFRYVFIFIIAVALHKNSLYINNNLLITVLDVGQGDSIFVKFSNNQGNILIDTSGEIQKNTVTWKQIKKDFSIVENKTIPYLKSLGINSLDYLIITHGDYDHMGEAINLVENFKVEKVIFNCGEFNDIEKELINLLDKKRIPYYSCIKELNIDKNKLYFLQTKEYDNENDNSNVIYTELDGYKFMFMGDASSTTEKEILDKYNLPAIDILKVGHHGSKTSSSKEFIDEINPSYSIISVGKNNRYEHPNKEVLENLENSKIYRTDQDGSIIFKIKNNKLKIETCSP